MLVSDGETLGSVMKRMTGKADDVKIDDPSTREHNPKIVRNDFSV